MLKFTETFSMTVETTPPSCVVHLSLHAFCSIWQQYPLWEANSANASLDGIFRAIWCPCFLGNSLHSAYSDVLTTVARRLVFVGGVVTGFHWRCVYRLSDNMPQSLWVWDMQRLSLLAVLEQTAPVRCFVWDPRRPRLALCTGNTKVYLWSPAGCVSVNVPVEGMDRVSPQCLPWHYNQTSFSSAAWTAHADLCYNKAVSGCVLLSKWIVCHLLVVATFSWYECYLVGHEAVKKIIILLLLEY